MYRVEEGTISILTLRRGSRLFDPREKEQSSWRAHQLDLGSESRVAAIGHVILIRQCDIPKHDSRLIKSHLAFRISWSAILPSSGFRTLGRTYFLVRQGVDPALGRAPSRPSPEVREPPRPGPSCLPAPSGKSDQAKADGLLDLWIGSGAKMEGRWRPRSSHMRQTPRA